MLFVRGRFKVTAAALDWLLAISRGVDIVCRSLALRLNDTFDFYDTSGLWCGITTERHVPVIFIFRRITEFTDLFRLGAWKVES